MGKVIFFHCKQIAYLILTSPGIRECEVIQWFVEPEARVEEFDKICEVQSDKASVDIPSRFTGVIKKLYYEAGEMAIVGKPLVDIDVREEDDDVVEPSYVDGAETEATDASNSSIRPSTKVQDMKSEEEAAPAVKKGKHASLATPAVRHISKELDIRIEDVTGTGKDGRVSKEDLYKFAEMRDSSSSTTSETLTTSQITPSPRYEDGPQQETQTQLTKMQSQMFKTMTRSLSIPHFLYADEVDFSGLSNLRQKINSSLAKSSGEQSMKLSYLPFIIKAMSLALHQYPILNARVEINNESATPTLMMRSQHNIGIAMDTPQGLLVPVIKNVSAMDIISIAQELSRLQSLASTGKFSSADLSGGTISLSNIGSIGGTYVSPVIVDKEVAILGVGKMRTIPAFDAAGNVVKKQICNFSWSADHRVVDGATMARAAEVVRGFVEDPATMMVRLR